MPAAYAHHRFGDQCIEMMPEKLKKVCLEHREVFDFGVHGPDILFYHHPLRKTDVNRYGGKLHHRSGWEFFTQAAKVYRDRDQRAVMMAYLLGFLAHFTMDSCCHGYINERTEHSEFTHNYIESQYEAYLMKKDGWNPVTVDRSEPLVPSAQNAAVIARFFPFPEKEIHTALKGHRKTMRLLYSPGQWKKKILRLVIRAIRLGGSFDDLFLDEKEDPGCRESNEIIDACRQRALTLYPGLMENLVQFLYEQRELDDYFHCDFEGERVIEQENA